MSFITSLLKNDLEKIGREVEPVITNTIIDIMNEDKNNKKIIDNIINKFIETIKTKIKDDKQIKIKLLSIMKDIINKKDTTGKDTIYTNVYRENIDLKKELDKLKEEINKLKSPLIAQNVEVLQTGGALTDKIGGALNDKIGGALNDKIGGDLTDKVGGALTDKVGGALTDKIGGALTDKTNSNGNLTETIGDATKGMESLNNITNGLKNIKDVKDIPLLGIILSIIISLSEQKIREDICSRLHNNKDKIVESAIRVFVKEITDNNYINDIEIAEVYDSIINNIKKMENVKNLPKPKNSIMNKLKESTTNIDLGFGRELNKFKTNIGKNFTRKNVGGKKNTHKKKSSKSKKYNHKSRTNRL